MGAIVGKLQQGRATCCAHPGTSQCLHVEGTLDRNPLAHCHHHPQADGGQFELCWPRLGRPDVRLSAVHGVVRWKCTPLPGGSGRRHWQSTRPGRAKRDHDGLSFHSGENERVKYLRDVSEVSITLTRFAVLCQCLFQGSSVPICVGHVEHIRGSDKRGTSIHHGKVNALSRYPATLTNYYARIV